MGYVKDSLYDLLIVFLSIAVLIVFIYFQQSQQWNQALKSRDQKISDLDQKMAQHQKGLDQARQTIASHEASSTNAAEELQSARQIIGELESGRQKSQKKIAELQEALKEKDSQLTQRDTRLATIKESTAKELAAQKNQIIELENMVGDQKLKLTQAEETIRRLEASEEALQERLQTAD